MLLSHARARAHTFIFRASDPSTTYPKAADVPDADAEDWEPITLPPPAESFVATAEDCGCPGTTPTDNEESDV